MSAIQHPYNDEVTYGSRQLTFHVVPAKRTTLGIAVHPDGRVVVRAPLDADSEFIRSRIKRRARWITHQQRRFATFVQPLMEKEYVSGETHRYLGGQYRLKIVRADATLEAVKLIGRFFEVHTNLPNVPEHTRVLLEAWYAEAARRHLHHRFVEAVAQMRRYGIGDPELVVRVMKRRWGSCTPTNRIMLNRWLVLAPTYCIDYVVIHELCHIIHPHHGRAFYQLLDRVLPDWRRRKEQLEQVQF
ncbi:MAG: SprT family zinc-dependent metalloprotease [Rhodothermales bacterium]